MSRLSMRLPGGQRQANVSGGRVGRHVVKVSAEEEAALLALSAQRNVTVSRLLVESTLRPDVGVTREDLRELLVKLDQGFRLLGSIANNVNQIARATNASHEIQDDLQGTLNAVRRVGVRIDGVMDDVSDRMKS